MTALRLAVGAIGVGGVGAVAFASREQVRPVEPVMLGVFAGFGLGFAAVVRRSPALGVAAIATPVAALAGATAGFQSLGEVVGSMSGRLTTSERERLDRLASAPTRHRVPSGRDIATARNAHATNTFHELEQALEGDFDWFEGDVRLVGDTAVMAHGAHDQGGLNLRDWVAIVSASGRGMKFDVKDPAALDSVLAAVGAERIPDHRLILNVGVGPDGVSDAQLRQARRAHPEAIINLSVSEPGMHVPELARRARLVSSGPVMFPIEIDEVTPAVVEQLRAHGRIAVWNDPDEHPVTDVARESSRLRRLGADGMIDLRS